MDNHLGKQSLASLYMLALICALAPRVPAQLQPASPPIRPPLHFADYDSEPRRPDGHVDTGALLARLQELHVITYYWLVWHAATVIPGELSYPWSTPSQRGDFVQATQTARLLPGAHPRLSFRERDDFTAGTSDYHFKQLLVNRSVVWEEDVAGGTNAWREVTVDLSPFACGPTNLTLAFRLLDRRGVSNFGVRWQIEELRTEGITLSADLGKPRSWQVSQHGPFEAGFGDRLKPPQRRFHVPFIVMTAGHAGEFRMRHVDPACPERMTEWLRFCLEAWRGGKCDGVVTYCLEKEPHSRTFGLARDLFRHYRPVRDGERPREP